jgi:hypothetical protein
LLISQFQLSNPLLLGGERIAYAGLPIFLSDVLCQPAADRSLTHNIPQRALKHMTPIQALKEWQKKKPELFVKRVYNQAGLDS